MSTEFLNAQIALDTHLSTLNGNAEIAWENSTYSPVVGTPFIQPALVGTPSQRITLSGDQQNLALYQMDLFYPIEEGMRNALMSADEIRAHFNSADSVTANGTEVYIRQVSRSDAASDGAWITLSVTADVVYYSN